jgi:hypothetical protein
VRSCPCDAESTRRHRDLARLSDARKPRPLPLTFTSPAPTAYRRRKPCSDLRRLTRTRRDQPRYCATRASRVRLAPKVLEARWTRFRITAPCAGCSCDRGKVGTRQKFLKRVGLDSVLPHRVLDVLATEVRSERAGCRGAYPHRTKFDLSPLSEQCR